MVEDFFAWLNNPEVAEVHPIIKAGITHYILVAIHPFVEGNGRTARAFASMILLKEGYDIKRFFSLEERFDSDPGSYYEAFAQVDKQSNNIGLRDLTPWLEYLQPNSLKLKKKLKSFQLTPDLRSKWVNR